MTRARPVADASRQIRRLGIYASSALSNLRYSDRKLLADAGSLGVLKSDEVPQALRVAVASVYHEAMSTRSVGSTFSHKFTSHLSQHFGKTLYPYPSTSNVDALILDEYQSVEAFLDTIEILVEEAGRRWTYDNGVSNVCAYPHIEDRLNRLFERHRFGYRISSGDVRRVGSPALDSAIVGPALIALAQPGWEEAERSFREALHHQRGGESERDDAITAAHAALEAALKAAGLKGDTLHALAKNFRNSGLVPSQLEGVPEALDKLLKRSSSIRDSLGDAHGKAPDAEAVPDGVADLAIYWTGAFVNYLADATRH